MKATFLILNRTLSTTARTTMVMLLALSSVAVAQDSLTTIRPDTIVAIVAKDTTIAIIAARDSTTIKPDTVGFKFFHDEFNFIEFYDRSALQNFFTKWKDDSTPKITVAHFGDSHVQPGIFPGEVRKYMQNQKGDGGYGMIFPYSAAKTYSPLDYKTVHYGRWQWSKALEPRPKMPLGISGMTVRTIDPAAGFMITFRQGLPAHYKRLRLFFKPGPQSFDFRILTGKNEVVVPAASYEADMPFTEIILPDSTSSIHVQLLKSRDEQLNFEFYGISLESEQNRGLVYHALGVGGAPYTAVLQQVLIDTQLPAISPDLIILDYGTNDFLYDQRIPAQLGRQIVQTINWVRQLAPGADILLTTTQDMYRRGVNIAAAKEFSDMIRRIAKEQKCALYDWYRISGGQYALSKWVSARLARPDYIHLTKEGYLLKGRLFSQAFARTYAKFNNNSRVDSLVMEGVTGVYGDSTNAVAMTFNPKQMITTRHRIRNGETLSEIADKYHVSVKSIMVRNNMKDSRIVAGNHLYVDHRAMRVSSTPIASRPVPVQQPPVAINDANLIRHKVVSGDTLGHIAEKYHVSVKEIKRINGLHSSRIVEGKVLLIPN